MRGVGAHRAVASLRVGDDRRLRRRGRHGLGDGLIAALTAATMEPHQRRRAGPAASAAAAAAQSVEAARGAAHVNHVIGRGQILESLASFRMGELAMAPVETPDDAQLWAQMADTLADDTSAIVLLPFVALLLHQKRRS